MVVSGGGGEVEEEGGGEEGEAEEGPGAHPPHPPTVNRGGSKAKVQMIGISRKKHFSAEFGFYYGIRNYMDCESFLGIEQNSIFQFCRWNLKNII